MPITLMDEESISSQLEEKQIKIAELQEQLSEAIEEKMKAAQELFKTHDKKIEAVDQQIAAEKQRVSATGEVPAVLDSEIKKLMTNRNSILEEIKKARQKMQSLKNK